MKNVAVIGNGKMAVDCLKILKEKKSNIVLIIADPENVSIKTLKVYCESEGLNLVESKKINSPDVLSLIKQSGANIIFNINSYKIIKKALIGIPKYGIINFHNGPLPRYRGVNICSWSIINGEKEHGVTWHYVNEGIDTGDIIGQRFFDVDKNETAITLIMKSIKEGVILFEEIITDILSDNITPINQDDKESFYYSLKDYPNEGILDLNWDFKKIDSFIRGLNFYPMKNNFVYPASTINEKKFYFYTVKRQSENNQNIEPGTVTAINESEMYIAILDSIISVKYLLNSSFKKIKIADFVNEYNLSPGVILGK